MPSKNALKKIIFEKFIINKKKGGGIIKFEAWEDKSHQIVKYNMTYINPLVFYEDNGRVLGYDNAHNFHHKHYFGKVYKVTDFISYEDLVQRFEQEIKEFIK
jgi:CHASE1-domain containing sensor protein